MGYQIPLAIRLVLALQASCVGLLAGQQHNQLVLQRELVGLRAEIRFLQETEIGAGGGGGDQDPSPVESGSPADRPDHSQVRQQALGGGWRSSADTCFVGLSIALFGVLVILIVLGHLYSQCIASRVDRSVLSSPSSKQQLAQRQLAELRLRRHGFAQ